MSNPYEAPGSPMAGGARDIPASTGPEAVKVPISAYILVVISALFVTFGSMVAVAFSPMLLGDWTATAPRALVVAIPFVAIGLGGLSGWQSFRSAKRAAERAKRR